MTELVDSIIGGEPMKKVIQRNLDLTVSSGRPAVIKLTPILEAARQILTEARKPLHVSEMADVATKSNRNFGLSSEVMAIKLANALASNLNTKAPSFSKVKNKTGGFKRGFYRIKSGHSEPSISAARNAPEPPAVSNNFLGKAGEHAVMSELLFWGYNASLMSVDEGIDIVASKQNHYFHIQVKAAAESDKGRFSYKIKNSAFNTHHAANTFYILVMRRKGGADFAILPSSHLNNLRGLGVIGGANDLSITITSDEKRRLFRLNNTDDVSLYINRFDVIK